jgi:hypothetical protein
MQPKSVPNAYDYTYPIDVSNGTKELVPDERFTDEERLITPIGAWSNHNVPQS